ncbi:hypothetical protein QAD02_002278 [Eretmocerus hayati]|uniref:Uncharacterized protein n=1 Tax=Eretmocerus hayati TaxID=131215 RepID=A0ACC2NIF1_9HYME|nr:hypothetical protein QAD02_002278 [Eretmocerus hayati]
MRDDQHQSARRRLNMEDCNSAPGTSKDSGIESKTGKTIRTIHRARIIGNTRYKPLKNRERKDLGNFTPSDYKKFKEYETMNPGELWVHKDPKTGEEDSIGNIIILSAGEESSSDLGSMSQLDFLSDEGSQGPSQNVHRSTRQTTTSSPNASFSRRSPGAAHVAPASVSLASTQSPVTSSRRKSPSHCSQNTYRRIRVPLSPAPSTRSSYQTHPSQTSFSQQRSPLPSASAQDAISPSSRNSPRRDSRMTSNRDRSPVLSASIRPSFARRRPANRSKTDKSCPRPPVTTAQGQTSPTLSSCNTPLRGSRTTHGRQRSPVLSALVRGSYSRQSPVHRSGSTNRHPRSPLPAKEDQTLLTPPCYSNPSRGSRTHSQPRSPIASASARSSFASKSSAPQLGMSDRRLRSPIPTGQGRASSTISSSNRSWNGSRIEFTLPLSRASVASVQNPITLESLGTRPAVTHERPRSPLSTEAGQASLTLSSTNRSGVEYSRPHTSVSRASVRDPLTLGSDATRSGTTPARPRSPVSMKPGQASFTLSSSGRPLNGSRQAYSRPRSPLPATPVRGSFTRSPEHRSPLKKRQRKCDLGKTEWISRPIDDAQQSRENIEPENSRDENPSDSPSYLNPRRPREWLQQILFSSSSTE